MMNLYTDLPAGVTRAGGCRRPVTARSWTPPPPPPSSRPWPSPRARCASLTCSVLTLAPKVAAVMAESRAGRRGGGGGRGWRRGGKPR